MPKRFVILISGRGSNMQAIVNMAKNREDIEIAAVISHKPNSAGTAWVAEQGVATAELLHKDYPVREEYDAALRDLVLSYQPDYVILAGFMRILTPVFIEPFANRLVNIHPSLLPSFTGLDTHERALAEGVKVHGCTVHFVTPVLDVGPIIAQGMVPVLASDDADTLAARVLKVEHQIYPAVVDYLSRDLLSVNEQQLVEYKEDVKTLFVSDCLLAR
ncbi:phosphoribosylglycinamide formyltransferase [Pelistega suis]|uniref:Phosphoribosylglycinamide formyltransferase n=2 Tax=Pelistega suis TaxID=1631957 RepID=A0A849P0E9_9BURK|nr:phosphoribosylglycinamide formyltransferase [Pelistega suis]NOL51229.1 phosphoribosylglycinamide formyltransferase [Pelistega suis]